MARLNLVVKLALFASLLFAATHQGWERFEGKGFSYRLVLFLLPTVLVPLVWRLRGSRPPYPHLVDLLISTPFLLDTLGNVFDFYGRYESTDDVLHFINWIPLTAGLTLAVCRTSIPRLATFAMGCGFGALAILWWELAEYLIMQAGSMGLNLTYGDTIGDLVLSSCGGIIGAALASRFASPAVSLEASQ